MENNIVRNVKALGAFFIGAIICYATVGQLAADHFLAKEAMTFFIMLFGWTAQTVVRAFYPDEESEMDHFIVAASILITIIFMMAADGPLEAIMCLCCSFLGTCAYFSFREVLREKLGWENLEDFFE